MGLKNQIAWNNYDKSNFPNDLPKNPASHYDEFYPSGGWGYFLGTGTISNKEKHENFLNYEEAKEYVCSLSLGTYENWVLYANGELEGFPEKPDNIPKGPSDVYDEFESWPEFLGSGIYSYLSGYSYKKAKEIIYPLGLNSEPEFKAWKNGKRPDLIPFDTNIPKRPDTTYRKSGEWISWPDFLGYDPYNPKGTGT